MTAGRRTGLGVSEACTVCAGRDVKNSVSQRRARRLVQAACPVGIAIFAGNLCPALCLSRHWTLRYIYHLQTAVCAPHSHDLPPPPPAAAPAVANMTAPTLQPPLVAALPPRRWSHGASTLMMSAQSVVPHHAPHHAPAAPPSHSPAPPPRSSAGTTSAAAATRSPSSVLLVALSVEGHYQRPLSSVAAGPSSAAEQVLHCRTACPACLPASPAPPDTHTPPPSPLNASPPLSPPTHPLQDMSAAVVLCEAVYRAVDLGPHQAELAIQRLRAQVPHAPHLAHVQWSPERQEQR